MRSSICLGTTPVAPNENRPRGEFVEDTSRIWYRITHVDAMPPFLVSVTNPSDIWMFVSTTGGITAGRVSKDNALFPYITVDKIHDSANHTGAVTAFLVDRNEGTYLWKPFDLAQPGVYRITRSFYKGAYGDAVMFEETNHTLGLEFRSGWEPSPGFGIHRFAVLRNTGDSPVAVDVLDGMRNILPAGATARMQAAFSNLVDAYKRCEVDSETGLGMYSLSATPSDLAEPSESLRATSVWSYGIGGTLMLSDSQIRAFETGAPVEPETDTKGRRGAYLRANHMELGASESRAWGMCAEVAQSSSEVADLRRRLRTDAGKLASDLQRDVSTSRKELSRILEINDGAQHVGSEESRFHHAANVMFNVMRGGYFVDGYTVDARHFAAFVKAWNSQAFATHETLLNALPPNLSITDLQVKMDQSAEPVLRRLAREYLPLTFSRRHGDPSRPWNEFSIQTHDSDGNSIIGYQGNWRDIFQNWEALCLSCPDYFQSVISKLLNATTADGYNPYRISQSGIDWEVPEPENPWANIGYWGDHQIVYLSRLMEKAESFFPGDLTRFLDDRVFVFANVPYHIKPFPALLRNPRDTIEFDRDQDKQTRASVEQLGADGRLILDGQGEPVLATMLEKLLILLLAKSGNYIAGGGIWLNTQRPEWNDANNALAGWGLSVVTVAYLVRFVDLVSRLVSGSNSKEFEMHLEVAEWLDQSSDALHSIAVSAANEPVARLDLLERLGSAAGAYRDRVYSKGLSSGGTLSRNAIEAYLGSFREHLISTLEATRNADGTFASYQMLSISGREAHVRPLSVMLEGQVAGLSSGLLDSPGVSKILDSLRSGPLYRADQHSYMLYPNRDLPGFMVKNRVDDADVRRLCIANRPHDEWRHVLEQDSEGVWHFSGWFRNAGDVEAATKGFSEEERDEVLSLFERTFDHASFTGRSGTFFAYEGLGSIYWHMVSKLLLAVQENLIDAIMRSESPEIVSALKSRYVDIRSGLGFNKDPATYGAVPTDPYSHTPWGQGAKQPGMTGQVKEEIVARYAELGLVVRDGRITFIPELILDDQWREETRDFQFTFCGVPFTVCQSTRGAIEVTGPDDQLVEVEGLMLPQDRSVDVFRRSGRVTSVRVYIHRA